MSDIAKELYEFDKKYRKKGQIIAGCDEAGRGPLAGPVVAAAVILPDECNIPGLFDSKKLSEKKRLLIEPLIKESAVSWAVAFVESDEIDRINILEASLKAMSIAVDSLDVIPDIILIDGPYCLRRDDYSQEAIIKGDSLSASIAAASILAKNERDRIMIEYDKIYPEYHFKKHKGYPTKEHRNAIKEFGFSPIHRKTFKVK